MDDNSKRIESELRELFSAAVECAEYYRYVMGYRMHDVTFLVENGINPNALEFLIENLDQLADTALTRIKAIENKRLRESDSKVIKLKFSKEPK